MLLEGLKTIVINLVVLCPEGEAHVTGMQSLLGALSCALRAVEPFSTVTVYFQVVCYLNVARQNLFLRYSTSQCVRCRH